MIGRTLSHYRIVAQLGRGGMGEVYLAEDTQLGRKVAIKVLPPELAKSRERLERLEREARAVAALNHPNIVTLYSVEEAEGVRFLTMEYVEGRTLTESMPAGGLPPKAFFGVAVPLAEALAAAHEKGVIHRDLKPGNVMLTPEGRVKVLDFGLAKLTQAEGASASQLTTEAVTGEGRVVGTVPYMSPEQIEGRPLDHRSDIFSLGVVLYELATGRRPFAGDSSPALISSILRDTPPPVSGARPDLPEPLGGILSRCLDKDPRQRYQSALDVRHALEDLVRPREVSSAATSAQVPVAPRRSGAPRAWLAGAAGVVVVAAVLVAANVGGLRDRLFGTGRAPTVRSLAVLPFENRMGDRSQDYFVEGIHEALIIELSQIGSLQVKARPAVMRYQKIEKPLSEIARELNVDALVTGSVLRAGESVQVTAELVEGSTEANLWANRYSRDLRNLASLSSEVTRDIAGGIRIALTPEQRARLGRTREVNPEAYETYLKARYLMNQFTPVSRAKALELFQRAIDLDPTFASAYAGLATVQGLANILGGGRPRANAAPVLAAARRALELDPNQGEAHAILGTHYLYAEWDWNAAETELRRALDLNPGNAFVYHPYGDYLLVKGRLEESLDYVRRGKDIDPLSPLIVLPVAGHLAFLGRYDEAIQEARKFLEIQPNAPWAQGTIENALWYKGEEEKSFHMMRAETEDKDLIALLDRGHAKGGPRGAMRALADSLVAQSRSRYVGPLGIAAAYAEARQTEQAFQWLEKAYEERTPFLLHLRADPQFTSLRSDPRFADLVRRIGFPQ
jgi:TolB-like protein/predicted Ser/Thr protein kinase